MMTSMLTRMFAYVTLVSYLFVGMAIVRVQMSTEHHVSIDTNYFKMFSPVTEKNEVTENLIIPEISFKEIKFQQPKIAKHKEVVSLKKKEVRRLEFTNVKYTELPFFEPVVLRPVSLKDILQKNLISLYEDFKKIPENNSKLASSVAIDEVSTIASAATDVEPEFFEYTKEEKQEDKKVLPSDDLDMMAQNETEKLSTNSQMINNVDNVDDVKRIVNEEENLNVDDMLTFDYSKAEKDIRVGASQSVTSVTIQNNTTAQRNEKSSSAVKASQNTTPVQNMGATLNQEHKGLEDNVDQNGFLSDEDPMTADMTIQIVGTNFNKSWPEAGFEVRYQDDLNEVTQDYNSGVVKFSEKIAAPQMTRAVSIVKRGFAPTNTELALENEDTEVTIPVIDDETFNEMIAPYESRGPIGAVLIALENEGEQANLDVPYSKVLKLDSEMKIVSGDEFQYLLFVGVKAGNALLTYVSENSEKTSKIIHVHERELTFDQSIYEVLEDEHIKLFEEDLLSKDSHPLIISSEEVREFSSGKKTEKINDHTFRANSKNSLLGNRKYLELSHLGEPIFIGYKNILNINVPSENFMRYILSNFEDSKLGNRCLIQTNLSKKAVKVDIESESVGSSLQITTQILDSDGKFYKSISEKSEKIIVVGEHGGSEEYSKDAKINFKITYADGSVQYFGSYCSPNSYLVEQL